MQIDKIPKIFISYSWSSDALVLELANRLVFHGVDVVLDKWDLKEGNDKLKVDISHILGNLITVIFDYQILRKPLKILSL